jgi:hypothetical protein
MREQADQTENAEQPEVERDEHHRAMALREVVRDVRLLVPAAGHPRQPETDGGQNAERDASDSCNGGSSHNTLP